MKTLGKLIINPEKMLKNEELKSLTGGWYGDCVVSIPGIGIVVSGPGAGSSLRSAERTCQDFYYSIWGSVTCACCC